MTKCEIQEFAQGPSHGVRYEVLPWVTDEGKTYITRPASESQRAPSLQSLQS